MAAGREILRGPYGSDVRFHHVTLLKKEPELAISSHAHRQAADPMAGRWSRSSRLAQLQGFLLADRNDVSARLEGSGAGHLLARRAGCARRSRFRSCHAPAVPSPLPHSPALREGYPSGGPPPKDRHGQLTHPKGWGLERLPARPDPALALVPLARQFGPLPL